MPIPLLAIAAAGSALQGIGTLASGYQTAKANKASALGAKIEGEMAMIRRDQIGEQAREQLASTLGNINALRTGRGVSLDSPTGRAIERGTMQASYRAEAIGRLAELQRASSASLQARGYNSAARWAMPITALNAAGSFGQAAAYGKSMRTG
jgi:hypothetical protein